MSLSTEGVHTVQKQTEAGLGLGLGLDLRLGLRLDLRLDLSQLGEDLTVRICHGNRKVKFVYRESHLGTAGNWSACCRPLE